MKLILPPNLERVVPDWFARALRETDPNLIVYFNPMRERWVIDRCTRGGVHNAAAHDHDPSCPRTNVTVVQDEGQYMPLCQAVIDDLRSRDAWSRYGSFETYDAVTQHAADAAKEETERKIDQMYHETTKDNRAQLAKAWTLIQRHDTARVNQ